MLRDLWRWTHGLLATAFWAFVMAGLLGMAEGLSQWLRFDVLSEGGPGFVRSVAPTVALYGWVGMAVAAVFYVPYHFIVRRRSRSRRHAYALALSTSLGLFVFFYAGYVFREHLAPEWWRAHEGGAALIVQVLLMIAASVLLTRPILAMASRQVLNPWRNMFLAVVFVAVFTSLWPNWREEGRESRLGVAASLAAPSAPKDGRERPHLILVTIDTLRRDAVSAVSPHAPPTPGLDAIAEEGILFTNFWSTSSWTLPAMSSIMTGRAPRDLGIEKYLGLPEDARTLAQVATAEGYLTAAFASNPYLLPTYGFDRGFDVFEHALLLEPLLPAERSVLARELAYLADTRLDLDDAAVVVGKAVRWLERTRIERPLFLWLHLMDPHLPYRWRPLPEDAPAPVPGRGTAPSREVVPDDPLFPDGIFPGTRLQEVREALPGVSEEVRTGLRALYDREVQYADACLAELWRSLRDLGIWNDALVIVTADHGEEFFEHGGFEHGHSLMPEVTGVPLLLRLPAARQGGRVSAVDHDLLDLMPSVCRFLDWRSPEDLDGGWDLIGPARSATDGPATAIMENMLYGPPQIALRDWPYLALTEAGRADTTWYDLDDDPDALAPLTAGPDGAAAIAAAARARLAIWDVRSERSADAAADSVDVSAGLRRQLRSLGY